MSPCLLFRRSVILLLESNSSESLEDLWLVEVPIKLFCVEQKKKKKTTRLFCVDRARSVVGRHVNASSVYTLRKSS